MSEIKIETKQELHPNNLHRSKYNLKDLVKHAPSLRNHIIKTPKGDTSINFFNPQAVVALNKALLSKHYGVKNWSIPQNFLCPPVPGRSDYLHHLADLIPSKGQKNPVNCLDIGTGAGCIFPILGHSLFNWSFVGSEIDQSAINSCKVILKNNPQFKDKIFIRKQNEAKNTLNGILRKEDYFDLVICNPPFHSSAKEAEQATKKKLRNLRKKNQVEMILNFGGQAKELWCEGGEYAFVKKLILESKANTESLNWISSMISKKTTLDHMFKELEKLSAKEIKVIPMKTGNKISRILCWRF